MWRVFYTSNLRLDNFVTVIDFVEKAGAEMLKNAVLEFMMKNLKDIKEKHEEYIIPQSYLWEIASRLVKNSK